MYANKLAYGFLAFNNWPVFERTLESAKKLYHTQGDVQWVIVDNSTNREVEDGLYTWMNDNPDLNILTIFNSGENVGEGAGMNQCFNMCDADNILFFQDDWECVTNYNFVDLAIETLDRFSAIFMVQLRKRSWKPYPKPYEPGDRNCSTGTYLMRQENNQVFQMADNGFGNNTFQVRLFKKSKWKQVGLYLEDKDIDWNRWPGARPGSISERDYGLRLAAHGFSAAKINSGQFDHTIEENARWNPDV